MQRSFQKKPGNDHQGMRQTFSVQRAGKGAGVLFTDKCSGGTAQHRLADKINTSQRQRAQGIRLSALFEPAAQLRPMPGADLAQRKSNVLQRESSYDGLMPGHDTWGDSYTFAGEKSTEFTYHHIIPENKLKLVTKELAGIKKYFDDLEQTDENEDLRGKGMALDNEVGGLITGAKAGWFKTRVQDVTHAINHTYDIYDISVTTTEVQNVMEAAGEALPELFTRFGALLKPKIKRLYEREKGSVKRVVTQGLKDPQFYNALNGADGTNIRAWLGLHFDATVFDLDAAVEQILPAVVKKINRKSKTALNKGRIRDVVVEAVNGSTKGSFDDYYLEECKPLYENSTASDTHLKKLLQKNALPHDASEHLEHAVQWNPGNIHRGPSSTKRLDPDAGVGFDELVDDGGDLFEKAAVNLLATPHFKKLVKLNSDIDTFLLTKVKDVAPDNAKVDLAQDIVRQMKAIQGLGLTQFKEKQWEMKGEDKMRLKKNQDLIDASK